MVASHTLKGFLGRADLALLTRQFAAFYRTCSLVLPTLAVFVLALGAQTLGLGGSLDRRLHDGLLRIVPRTSPAPSASLPDALVVTIDPRSLRALDDWPWPRRMHASAIERLDAAGARAIAFDIDFSLPSNAEDDRRFAEGIAASGHVALATFSQTERLQNGISLEIVNRPIEALAAGAAERRPELVDRLRQQAAAAESGSRPADGSRDSFPASPSILEGTEPLEGVLNEPLDGVDRLLDTVDTQLDILDADRGVDELLSAIESVDVEEITQGATFPNGLTTPLLSELEGIDVSQIIQLSDAMEAMQEASAGAGQPWTPTDVTTFIENDLITQGLDVEDASRLIRQLFGN